MRRAREEGRRVEARRVNRQGARGARSGRGRAAVRGARGRCVQGDRQEGSRGAQAGRRRRGARGRRREGHREARGRDATGLSPGLTSLARLRRRREQRVSRLHREPGLASPGEGGGFAWTADASVVSVEEWSCVRWVLQRRIVRVETPSRSASSVWSIRSVSCDCASRERVSSPLLFRGSRGRSWTGAFGVSAGRTRRRPYVAIVAAWIATNRT